MEVRAPRAPSVSRFRSNAGYYEDTETYYRINVFIPAVEAVTLDLQDRFSKQQKAAFSLAFLLPKHVTSATWDLVQPSFQKYTNVLRWQVSEVSEEQAKAEFAVWSAMCRLKLQGQLAQDAVSAISAVNLCPADSLPTIHTMLMILVTMPVCTAKAERLFSKVECTLSALRSSMSEALTCILLQAHQELLPETDEIIHRFTLAGADGRRRMDLMA